MTTAPLLSALICDGMGWFTPTDLKRAVLLFDRVEYLIPSDTVEFKDERGRLRYMAFPGSLTERSAVTIRHYTPSTEARKIIAAASDTDVKDAAFLERFADIPLAERTYTWRVVNADADIGGGSSLGLTPSQGPLAHALLLNKFFLAADEYQAIPITGKAYIHPLIATKYEGARRAFAALVQSSGGRLPSALTSKLQPVTRAVADVFISNEELEKRSFDDILEYRERHRDLFQQFTLEMLKLSDSVQALPGTREFEERLHQLLVTEVAQKRKNLQEEMRSAWTGFFKTSGKAVAAGILGVGVTPLMPLAALVTAAAAASATWLVPDLVDIWSRYRKVRNHGLYYLTHYTA